MALLHFLLSLPMQRRDRGLFFLDLVETALNRGQSVENAILSAAETHDRVMGVGFYLLAAHIENGADLAKRWKKCRFSASQVNAILRAGEKMGDIKKVLPACREVLRVPPDPVRTTMHYMVAILLLFAVVACMMIWLVSVFVIPRFNDVATGTGVPIWAFMNLFLPNVSGWLRLRCWFSSRLVMVAVIYIGGPGFVRWFQFCGVPVVDWITWRIAVEAEEIATDIFGHARRAAGWRRAGSRGRPAGGRFHGQRNLPPARAARHRRAEKGASSMTPSAPSTTAANFTGGLTNATHARGGFLNALRGWHEALEAKAFQQEETATHATTSGLVILNGVVVALIATAMFGMLVQILKECAA